MMLEIDAGGTYLRAKIYKKGVEQKSYKTKSAEIGLAEWMEPIIAENDEIKTINISFAGQVCGDKIISSPNIKIDKKDIKNYFQERFDVEVFIYNDLNYVALKKAEYFKSDNIAVIYVGTGLGLGVVSSGRLISGMGGVATEIGHIPYKKAPFVCGCGKDNCMELFASGIALSKWKRYLNIDDDIDLEGLKEMRSDIYKEFEEALLYATATTITLFNPEILLLGGGVIQNNPYLVEIIKEKIVQYAMGITLENVKIVGDLKDG